MTIKQVAKTSVTANNSPLQDYDLTADDLTQSTYEMTSTFKPSTNKKKSIHKTRVLFTNYPPYNSNCQYLIFFLFSIIFNTPIFLFFRNMPKVLKPVKKALSN